MFFGDCPTKPRFWAKQPHGTSRTGHEGRGRTRRKLADDDDDESRAPSAHPPRIPHCPLFHLNKNKSPDRAPLLADDKTGRNNARQTKANSSCVARRTLAFCFFVHRLSRSESRTILPPRRHFGSRRLLPSDCDTCKARSNSN